MCVVGRRGREGRMCVCCRKERKGRKEGCVCVVGEEGKEGCVCCKEGEEGKMERRVKERRKVLIRKERFG